ncbi:MAG TPA: hypothetical protein VIY72_05445 [Acidimicrobiales bacterium]
MTTTSSTTPEALPQTTTTSEPAAGVGKEFFVYAPVEGDCIDLRATGPDGATTTRAVPEEDATIRGTNQLILRLDCGLPHQYEVIAVVGPDLPKTPTPDDVALVSAAKQLCPPVFATYVGTPYQDSELEVGWILPTGEQRRRGVLQIGCLAFDPEGKLIGSVRGSGR